MLFWLQPRYIWLIIYQRLFQNSHTFFSSIDVGTNPKADISMKLISNLVQLTFRSFLRSRYRFSLLSLAFSKFSLWHIVNSIGNTSPLAVTIHASGRELSNKDDVDSKPIRSAYSLFPFFIIDYRCWHIVYRTELCLQVNRPLLRALEQNESTCLCLLYTTQATIFRSNFPPPCQICVCGKRWYKISFANAENIWWQDLYSLLSLWDSSGCASINDRFY